MKKINGPTGQTLAWGTPDIILMSSLRVTTKKLSVKTTQRVVSAVQ